MSARSVAGPSAQQHGDDPVALTVVGDGRPVEVRLERARNGHRRQAGAAAALLIDQDVDLQHGVGPVGADIARSGNGSEQGFDAASRAVERLRIGPGQADLQGSRRLLAKEQELGPAAGFG